MNQYNMKILGAILILSIFIGGCTPSNSSGITPSSESVQIDNEKSYPELTPTICTGWVCSLEGVVSIAGSSENKTMADIPVYLSQSSWCSPTKGVHETKLDSNGKFVFEIYLHDTDTFWLEISLEGYQPVKQLISGFDCLYCSCQPIEIILEPLN